MIEVGSKLSNGAVVMAVKSKDDYHIVLAKWERTESDPTPFVTWAVDKEGNAYWGHYYGNQEKAMKDFLSR